MSDDKDVTEDATKNKIKTWVHEVMDERDVRHAEARKEADEAEQAAKEEHLKNSPAYQIRRFLGF